MTGKIKSILLAGLVAGTSTATIGGVTLGAVTATGLTVFSAAPAAAQQGDAARDERADSEDRRGGEGRERGGRHGKKAGKHGGKYGRNHAANRAERFQSMDTDGDGKVTRAELDGLAAKHFAAADADGNGELSAAEMLARGEARAAERKAARAKDRVTRMIERRDTDRNGTLSQSEMQGDRDGTRFFERLDTNGDGAVSKEEFEAGAKAARKAGKPRPAKPSEGGDADDKG